VGTRGWGAGASVGVTHRFNILVLNAFSENLYFKFLLQMSKLIQSTCKALIKMKMKYNL